jgi:hypothetical protein
VRPRIGYSLVHRELGSDHVRVDRLGRPVLIDIEGLMWADTEWEHAFLELRFGDHYAALRAADLDEARLQLYRLALHISLVEGPQLLETDFPDADTMRDIAEYNLAQALAAVSWQRPADEEHLAFVGTTRQSKLAIRIVTGCGMPRQEI